MAGRLTVWGAGQLLTTYFTKVTLPPGSFYLALIREIAPTPYLSGSELDEPDNDDYSRVEISNDQVSWGPYLPQEIVNLQAAEFITASSDWGQIRYWALCNEMVDGENLLVGELENPVLIKAGDQAVFEEGDLSVTLGPFFLTEED